MNIEQISNEELKEDLKKGKKHLWIGMALMIPTGMMIYLDFQLASDNYQERNVTFYFFFIATVYLIGMTLKLLPKLFSILIHLLFISMELKRRKHDTGNN